MLRIACIQMDCTPGDVTKNLRKALSLIQEAHASGANLVLLPELFDVGYDFTAYQEMNYDYAETRNILSNIAKDLGIYLIAGLLEIQGDDYYNSLQVFDLHGELLSRYCKLNLFPLSHEEEIFLPGDEAVVFEIEGVKIGLMICFDLRFPELSREYYREECDLILLSSAFPFPRLDHWRTLLKARAIENQMYVAAANRVGKDGELTFFGNSCVIDPWGTVVATANETDETIIIQEIDLENVRTIRQGMPVRKNYLRLMNLLDQK